MSPRYFVTGIGTEVGKTLASAILVRALAADYWKPVQAGDLDFSDSDRVQIWSGAAADRIHPETLRLQRPMSPHAAAAAEDIQISLSDFSIPNTDRPLIIEGAGGLMVPLNEQDDMIDLIGHLGVPVILVSRNYLGSINHTLLSIAALQQRQIPIAGLIFNGPTVPTTESIILQRSGLSCLLRIPELEVVDAAALEGLVHGTRSAKSAWGWAADFPSADQ